MLSPGITVPKGAEQLWSVGEFALQLLKAKVDPRIKVAQPDQGMLPLRIQVELEQIAECCC
jgi:hypothetical protein